MGSVRFKGSGLTAPNERNMADSLKLIYVRGDLALYAPIHAQVKHLQGVRPHIIVNGVEYKYCFCCDTWRKLGCFSADLGKGDDLQSFCKSCQEGFHKKVVGRKFPGLDLSSISA